MKTLKKREKRIAVLAAVGLNALVFTVLQLLCRYGYNADDFVLSQFLANGRTEFVFSNVLLEKAFMIVQQWIYPLNAYVIISLFFAFCAMTIMLELPKDKNRRKYEKMAVNFHNDWRSPAANCGLCHGTSHRE